jgi:hypothetical protein
MRKITGAFCLVAVCLLATSPTLAECPAGSSARADGSCWNSRCPKGSSPIANGTCLPDWYHAPSSPSAETTVKPPRPSDEIKTRTLYCREILAQY